MIPCYLFIDFLSIVFCVLTQSLDQFIMQIFMYAYSSSDVS